MKKINVKLSDVGKDQLQIITYLLLSGGLGYLSAKYIANDIALTAIFAPVINYLLYFIKQELDKKGVIQALKN